MYLGFRASGGFIRHLYHFSLAQKPKEIKVETFRTDYLIRTPKVEKLSLQPIRFRRVL